MITGSDEVRLRQGYLTTWTVVKERLEIVVEKDIPTLQGVDMWFASGSMEYLRYLATPLLTPKTCWLSSGGRRKPSCCKGWQWTSVSHSRVGGTTSATGMFGFVGLPQIAVPADPIRRAIGHIVKYSERPVPCRVPFVGDHYTVADLLSVHKLEILVVFSSGFSRTGWGYRTLVDSEIGQAYDLPSFVSWEARFVKDILPLQVFRVVAEAAWNAISLKVLDEDMSCTKKSRGTHEEGDHTATIDAFWVQSIGKWLPGTWADAPIADRAVKSDDAIVDFSPWWNRIRLVLPCPLKNLVSFEELGMHYWRRSLRHSFVRYLTGRYGHNWLEESTRRREVGDLAEPSAMRRRRVVSLNETHTKEGGGVRRKNGGWRG